MVSPLTWLDLKMDNGPSAVKGNSYRKIRHRDQDFLKSKHFLYEQFPISSSGPGIFFILPCLDNYMKVDLRTVTFDVPPQEVSQLDEGTMVQNSLI